VEKTDPVDSFLDDIYLTLKERISSLFISSFVIAWSVVNYI